uniref:Myelin-oligodendrocyte glycoprotein-like n=2 Tax=Astyanax mexicanus TaxID=7994 RepID=A0A3B1JI37_ASTMX
MVKRCLISCMFLLVINKVSSEMAVAVEGGNVTLPCVYSGNVPQSEEMDVFWRYNDRNVYSIFKGKVSATGQDPEYKGRTESYPEAYGQGNFSIKLSNVKASDKGEYKCILTFAVNITSIQLKVTAPQPTAPQPTPKPRNKGVGSRSAKILLIFTALLGYNQVLL